MSEPTAARGLPMTKTDTDDESHEEVQRDRHVLQSDLDYAAEETEFKTELVVRRLDYLHDILETIAAHSDRESEIQASQHARDIVIESQKDLNEMRELIEGLADDE